MNAPRLRRACLALLAAAVAVAPSVVHLESAHADVAATTGPFTVSPTNEKFGHALIADYSSASVTVTNSGNGNVQVSADYDGAAPIYDDFIGSPPRPCYGGGLALVLAPGDTCTVDSIFAPSESGNHSGQMTVAFHPAELTAGTYENYSSSTVLKSIVVKQKGTGDKPPYTLSPTSLKFPKLTLSQSMTKTITVTNTSPLTLQFQLDGPPASPFQQVPATSGPAHCAFTGDQYWAVAPGASCDFDLKFEPTETGGQKATFPVVARRTFDAPGAYAPLAFSTPSVLKKFKASGTAVAPTFDVVEKPAFAPTYVSDMPTDTLVLENTSTIPLVLRVTSEAPEFAVANPAVPSLPQCGYATSDLYYVLAPGQQCETGIRFIPQYAGSFSTTLHVDAFASSMPVGAFYNGPVEGPVRATETVKVTGKGKSVKITSTPSSVAFGKTAVSAATTKTIVVKTDAPFPIAIVVSPNGPSGDISLSPQPGPGHCEILTDHWVVTPGSTCDLTFAFAPASPGAQTASFVLVATRATASSGYQSGAGGQALGFREVTLTGTGV